MALILHPDTSKSTARPQPHRTALRTLYRSLLIAVAPSWSDVPSPASFTSKYGVDTPAGKVSYTGPFVEIFDHLYEKFKEALAFENNQDATYNVDGLILRQLLRGFIPGKFCGVDVYSMRYYADTLDGSGLRQIDVIIDSDTQMVSYTPTRDLLNALGQATLETGRDAMVQNYALMLSNGCFGELGSGFMVPNTPENQRDVLASYTLPSLLAAAVASRKFRVPLVDTGTRALEAHKAYWAAHPGPTLNGHLYALAEAWKAASTS